MIPRPTVVALHKLPSVIFPAADAENLFSIAVGKRLHMYPPPCRDCALDHTHRSFGDQGYLGIASAESLGMMKIFRGPVPPRIDKGNRLTTPRLVEVVARPHDQTLRSASSPRAPPSELAASLSSYKNRRIHFTRSAYCAASNSRRLCVRTFKEKLFVWSGAPSRVHAEALLTLARSTSCYRAIPVHPSPFAPRRRSQLFEQL